MRENKMLKVLRGIVTQLSQRAKLHNTEHRSSLRSVRVGTARYTNINEITVDTQPARLSLGDPAHIEQNDEVALADINLFGKLHALIRT